MGQLLLQMMVLPMKRPVPNSKMGQVSMTMTLLVHPMLLKIPTALSLFILKMVVQWLKDKKQQKSLQAKN